MSAPEIADAIDRAFAAGVPPESLVGVLAARGWPEKDVYAALGDRYQRLAGVDIPRRGPRTEASARDAFFYLLIFTTLSIWAIGFGSLAFDLADQFLADPLFNGYSDTSSITSSLASLIVVFPLYLLISRIVLKDALAHPEKRLSPVRKWLTYMALVIAATVFIGDLISVLSSLLHGDLTSRFIVKCFVVFLLSGGIFFYYYSGLQKIDAAPERSSRDRLFAGVSSAFVLLLIVLGFLQLGPPRAQRDLRADYRRIREIHALSNLVEVYWKTHGSKLPAALDEVGYGPHVDPATRVPYEYHPGEHSNYQLCASFVRPSDPREVTPNPDFWIHPAGRYCYTLDATVPATPLGPYTGREQ